MSSVEIIIGRERVITALGIVGVVALSWAYLWTGAGIGMSALEMTAVALFPHRLADGGGGMDPSLPTVILMWWVMMIAMMTPSAAPLVLLYRRVLRQHAAIKARSAVLSLFLLSGYLTAWLAFSICAASLQKVLQPTGLISEMMLWSKSAPLSAIVLDSAAVYPFSPLKRAA
jgi:predicted metal-binding membrane protein